MEIRGTKKSAALFRELCHFEFVCFTTRYNFLEDNFVL